MLGKKRQLLLLLCILLISILIYPQISQSAPNGNQALFLPLIQKARVFTATPSIGKFTTVTDIESAGDEPLFIDERDGTIVVI